MKKHLITAAIALSTLLTAAQVTADSERNSYIDTARVLDVEPIYETVSISIPEERCWSRPYRRNHHQSSNQQSSYTGTIAGGIIGGVMGNQFGHGSGKKVMTVAGTLLGLSIGHDLSRDAGYPSSDDNFSYQSDNHRDRKEHSETTTHYESRQEIVGYRVKYRYKGNRFWTRTRNHPGKRIKVRVQVRPLHDDF